MSMDTFMFWTMGVPLGLMMWLIVIGLGWSLYKLMREL